jgi:hypothetical protein
MGRNRGVARRSPISPPSPPTPLGNSAGARQTRRSASWDEMSALAATAALRPWLPGPNTRAALQAPSMISSSSSASALGSRAPACAASWLRRPTTARLCSAAARCPGWSGGGRAELRRLFDSLDLMVTYHPRQHTARVSITLARDGGDPLRGSDPCPWQDSNLQPAVFSIWPTMAILSVASTGEASGGTDQIR